MDILELQNLVEGYIIISALYSKFLDRGAGMDRMFRSELTHTVLAGLFLSERGREVAMFDLFNEHIIF